MNAPFDIEEGGPSRGTTRPCGRCGQSAAPIAMLDSRGGQTFHMFRCPSCEQISWLEDRPESSSE